MKDTGICQMKYASPLGEMILAASDDAVKAVVFTGQKYEKKHIPENTPEKETPVLRALAEWLDRYFASEDPGKFAYRLEPAGSDYRKRVWKQLETIPYGTVCTYGEIAKALGSSARAAGGAIGANPVSILIPCHRVIGANRQLTGYAGGLERKKKLLELEGIGL